MAALLDAGVRPPPELLTAEECRAAQIGRRCGRTGEPTPAMIAERCAAIREAAVIRAVRVCSIRPDGRRGDFGRYRLILETSLPLDENELKLAIVEGQQVINARRTGPQGRDGQDRGPGIRTIAGPPARRGGTDR